MITKLLSALEIGRQRFGTFAGLSRASGVPEANISRWRKGQVPRVTEYAQILEAVHAQVVFPHENFFQHEFIPSGRARLTAEGTLSISEAPAAPWPFERSWLLQHAINQASSIMIEVEDAMMYPVLAKGDYALVDQADKMIKSGSIYLLSLGGELMFRKLVRSPNGLLIIAEAPGIPELPASMGGADYSGLTIHGRVRWASRLFD